MMILQDYSGAGLGKELMRLMEEHARQIGVIRIEAQVRVKNERAVRLYQSAGFEIEGTRRREALIGGEMQDSYYIAKLLSP
jgi:RimJ/RimL family protein N-acetyltransferase